jgi:hypothetical protein
VTSWTASAETEPVGYVSPPDTYAGGAYVRYPTGSPSMSTTRPHDPQSRRSSETQVSFTDARSSGSVRRRRTGSTSQKTQSRHGRSRAARWSTVKGAVVRVI